MLSLDPHDKFSAINTRKLSRWLVSGSSLSGSGDILRFCPAMQKSMTFPKRLWQLKG